MKNIVFFGDSNTWGFRPEDALRHAYSVRYTGKLQKMLGDEYLVYEEGMNGRTAATYDGITPFACGLDYISVTLTVNAPADMVVIMLGTNDTKPHLGQTPQSIAKGIEKLVLEAKKPEYGAGVSPDVVVVSPIKIGSDVERTRDMSYYFDKSSLEKQSGLAKLYEKVAKQNGCLFMDAAKYAQPSIVDAIHLDEKGHDDLAHAFYELITQFYGKK